MRYLKTYNIFESSSSGKFSEDMVNDIKDILLELSDEDIDISNIKEINYNPPLVDGKIEALNIDIHSNSFFTWDDIKDAILRLEEYLWRFGSGYRFDVEVTRDDDWMSLSRFIDVYGGEEFTKPGISLLIYSEEDYNKLDGDLDDLLESTKEYKRYKDIISDAKYILAELEDDGLKVDIIEDDLGIIKFKIDSRFEYYEPSLDDDTYIKQGDNLIGPSNIHIIDQCISYLKSELKPIGKNIYDDLDIYFTTTGRRKKVNSYPIFKNFIENGNEVLEIKFTFTT